MKRLADDTDKLAKRISERVKVARQVLATPDSNGAST
jgi:hypothetical protein